jgi:hypothetical protein
MRLLTIAFMAAQLATRALGAQDVGHAPEASPFRDLPYRQELSLFAGYYNGSEGKAGVAPAGGPAIGMRYEIRIGGPAQFTARLTHATPDRTVLDPALAESVRNLGERAWPITIADVGISLNLTGQKSWRRLVPSLHGGVGIGSDFGKSGDPGGFDFGTPFAFTFGGGVRLERDGPLQLRIDVADYLYQLEYPAAYTSAPAGSTPILSAGSSTSEWTHNLLLSVGLSYRYSR